MCKEKNVYGREVKSHHAYVVWQHWQQLQVKTDFIRVLLLLALLRSMLTCAGAALKYILSVLKDLLLKTLRHLSAFWERFDHIGKS